MLLKSKCPRYTRVHRHAYTRTCQHAHVYHHEFHAPTPTHSVGEGKKKRQSVCGEIDAGWDTRKRLYVL